MKKIKRKLNTCHLKKEQSGRITTTWFYNEPTTAVNKTVQLKDRYIGEIPLIDTQKYAHLDFWQNAGTPVSENSFLSNDVGRPE